MATVNKATRTFQIVVSSTQRSANSCMFDGMGATSSRGILHAAPASLVRKRILSSHTSTKVCSGSSIGSSFHGQNRMVAAAVLPVVRFCRDRGICVKWFTSTQATAASRRICTAAFHATLRQCDFSRDAIISRNTLHSSSFSNCAAIAVSIDKKEEKTSNGRRFMTSSAYWGERLKDKQYSEEVIADWRASFPYLEQYDDEALQAWRRVFDSMDRDNDGFISQADLQKTPEFTLAKAQKLKDYDADQNNLIDFGEFVEALYNVDKEMFLESFEGFDHVDVQLEFDKYAVVDEISPTKKHIPQSRVESIMADHKFTCITELDARRLFEELDVNHDGVIDFADFKECVQRKL